MMIAKLIARLINKNVANNIFSNENLNSILSLFSAGEQGAWYDPSDFSTMFQDAAGTIPVTAVGQAVGRILDKSGRGNHATQTTSTKRPVLQQGANGKYYLLFDGIDDALQTASVNFTGTDKVTLWAGVSKLSDAARGMIVEFGNVQLNSFRLNSSISNVTAGAAYRFDTSGSIEAFSSTNTIYPAPITNTVTGIGDILNNICTIKVNNVNSDFLKSGSTGTGNYGNYPLFIGSRGATSLPFNGRLYSLIIRGAQSTATQISNTEAYVNSRTGAY